MFQKEKQGVVGHESLFHVEEGGTVPFIEKEGTRGKEPGRTLSRTKLLIAIEFGFKSLVQKGTQGERRPAIREKRKLTRRKKGCRL